MNVAQTLKTLTYLPPRTSVLLEGNHGLGKSDVVAQAAAALSKMLNKPFGFIDFRLATVEVGDILGLPRFVQQGEVIQNTFYNGVRTEERRQVVNVTVHDLAEWFPTDPDSCGFLFLDELIRAPRDVQNAIMELALDYRYHFRSLPIGWSVISAGNNDLDIYSGTQFDPALYDRFLKIKFEPTVPEWLTYAESIGVHRAILQYISKVNHDLGLDIKPEPGVITPSPRAWVKLSKLMDGMKEKGLDVMQDLDYLCLLAMGYIGPIAIGWIDYVRKNFKIHSVEDILNKFDKLKDEFAAMDVTEFAFYEKEIIGYVKKSGDALLSDKQAKNLYHYLITMPKEAASGFFINFSAACPKAATSWYKKEMTFEDKRGPLVQEYMLSVLSKTKALKGNKELKDELSLELNKMK